MTTNQRRDIGGVCCWNLAHDRLWIHGICITIPRPQPAHWQPRYDVRLSTLSVLYCRCCIVFRIIVGFFLFHLTSSSRRPSRQYVSQQSLPAWGQMGTLSYAYVLGSLDFLSGYPPDSTRNGNPESAASAGCRLCYGIVFSFRWVVP